MQRTHPSQADTIRKVRIDELETALAIINAAAAAYRGVIPDDCWHDPYMSAAELQSEIAAGVDFSGCEVSGVLAGVMGVQLKGNVALIRHAYVSPAHQGRGIGGVLLAHLCAHMQRPILIGTWAAATWAIRFYRRHGFELISLASTITLLNAYWTVSPRQIETSVVLARPALNDEDVATLVGAR